MNWTDVSQGLAAKFTNNPAVTANTGSNFHGTWATVTPNTSFTMTGTLYGAVNRVQPGSSQSGNITGMTGAVNDIYNYATGTVGTANGTAAGVSNLGGGTISAASGVSASVANSSGTITNAYGLYTGGIQGTNHWALYTSDSSPSYFGGNVGIGTTTPVSPLQVGPQIGSSTPAFMVRSNTSGIAALRVQPGSGGNPISAHNGSGTEIFTIKDSGYVGIGTTAPSANLDVAGYQRNATAWGAVNGQGSYTMWNYSGGNGEYDFVNHRGLGGGGFYFYNATNANVIGAPIASIDGAGTYASASDVRLKKDLVPLENPLEKLLSLDGYTYYWKNKDRGTERQLGVIAQDVQKVYPEAVRQDPKSKFYSVTYDHLVAAVIAAVKEFHGLWAADSADLHRELASVKEDLAKTKQDAAAKDQELAAIKAYLCAKDPQAPVCH